MKPLWKSIKYLVWLAPTLIVAGLTAGIISATWVPIPLALILGGLLILGIWLVYQISTLQGFWKQRATEAGTNAVIATLSVLLILGLINFLGVRYMARIDLTENQIFTLAPQTKQVLRNLEEPVKVFIFSSQADPLDRELLNSYQRIGGRNFTYEYIDPQLRPGIAQEFGVRAQTDIGNVYIEAVTPDTEAEASTARRELIQNISPDRRLAENRLTSSIQRVVSDRQAVVYFLQGHGERPLEEGRGGFSQALASLNNKNYISQPLNLADRAQVPPDADVVVIAGPKRELFEAEVQALQQYLERGGSLLVMIDPGTEPGLEPLLREWGVRLDNRFAVDATGSGRLVGLGPAEPLITRYGDHPITRDFRDGYSFYPLARPLEVSSVPGVKETPLLISADQSWAESNPQSQTLEFNAETDRQGPLLLGVALSRSIQNPETTNQSPSPSPSPEVSPSPEASPSPSPSPEVSPSPETSPEASPSPSPSPDVSPSPEASPEASSSPEASLSPSPSPSISPDPEAEAVPIRDARMVVIGNSEFATDGRFERQLNGDVFLNAVTWLVNTDEQALSIRPRETRNRRINLSIPQGRLIGWTAIAIVPLIGLAIAVFLWIRRR